MVLKTILTQMLLTAALSVSPVSAGTTKQDVSNNRETFTLVMPDTKAPIAKEYRKKSVYRKLADKFLHFKLEGRCDTNVTQQLTDALASYSGPEVKITSLRRHWNNSSRHNHGKAVDMEFKHDLIEWLVSPTGQQWLNDHNLMFYIEGRPGSKKLKPYKLDSTYSKYVFENPHAKGRTGDHIHIGIKS